MKGQGGNKIVRAIVGAIGGSIVSMVVTGLIVAILEFHIKTIWPAIPFGAVLGAILSVIFPKVAAVLLEFIG